MHTIHREGDLIRHIQTLMKYIAAGKAELTNIV
jgi:hypothetical protein